MTKKDYIKAASITQTHHRMHKLSCERGDTKAQRDMYASVAECVENAFVSLFRGDNPAFDVTRFRKACEA